MIHRSKSKTLTLRRWRDFQTPILVERDWQTLGGSIGGILDRAATNLFGMLACARIRCTIIAGGQAGITAD